MHKLMGTKEEENLSEERENRVEKLRELTCQVLCLDYKYNTIPFSPQSNYYFRLADTVLKF